MLLYVKRPDRTSCCVGRAEELAPGGARLSVTRLTRRRSPAQEAHVVNTKCRFSGSPPGWGTLVGWAIDGIGVLY
jgi:hypothetical protein